MPHPELPELYDPETLPVHRRLLEAQGLTVWELSVMECLLLNEGRGALGWLHFLGYDTRTIQRVGFTHTLVDDGPILLVGAKTRNAQCQPWPDSRFWAWVRKGAYP